MELTIKKVNMLLSRDARDRVLLVKRPPAGLWGGLWGLPECTQKNVRAWCHDHIGLDIRPQQAWPAFRHSFSHFHLDITPIPARATGPCEGAMENGDSVWYNVTRPDARGLSADESRGRHPGGHDGSDDRGSRREGDANR